MRDVPIFGAAPRVGRVALNLRDGPASLAPRHAGLQGRSGVFGIYVPDASVSPWREPGEVVFVQRGRPAVVGGYAVAVLAGEDEAQPDIVIGKLVEMTGERVVLAQFSPRRDIPLDAAAIRDLLYVLTQAEVFGF